MANNTPMTESRPLTDQEIDVVSGGSLLSELKQIAAEILQSLGVGTTPPPPPPCRGFGPKPTV